MVEEVEANLAIFSFQILMLVGRIFSGCLGQMMIKGSGGVYGGCITFINEEEASEIRRNEVVTLSHESQRGQLGFAVVRENN